MNFEMFVGEIPEVLLPTNLDVSMETESEPLKGANKLLTPSCSLKEPDICVPWTEVVRRGKYKSCYE
jgi:hypothetical protein